MVLSPRFPSSALFLDHVLPSLDLYHRDSAASDLFLMLIETREQLFLKRSIFLSAKRHTIVERRHRLSDRVSFLPAPYVPEVHQGKIADP